MCGIAGIWSGKEEDSLDLLDKFTAAITLLDHRGPDDVGIETLKTYRDTLILGHKRLSIIDLSTAGRQPFFSSDDRYSLVFNGEIYNYKELREELIAIGYSFRSNSDTEVLLYSWVEWKIEALKKLRGMFAFSIYDATENTLFCARDPFGIKPFYYSYQKDKLSFASEPAALVHLLDEKPTINLKQAYDYLVFGSYDIGSLSFFNEIQQLPPAHYMYLDMGLRKLSIQKWWDPSTRKTSSLTREEAVIKLRELFLDSVKMHLRSDVPIGTALSGGIDSSAIVCAIRYIDPKIDINTFSYIAKDSEFDEREWVDLVNDHVGAKSHKVYVSSEQLIEETEELIKAQGEPFGGTSIYAQYKVFEEAKKANVIVTLDGQGADEILAGYNGYPGAMLHSLWSRGKLLHFFKFLRNWSSRPGRKTKDALYSFLWRFISGRMKVKALKAIGIHSAPTWIELEAFQKGKVATGKLNVDSYKVDNKRHLIGKLKEALTSNLPNLLRHADRNSMYWSVESRVPFLNIDMVEFLFSLPEEYLISLDGETKDVFRHAMRGIVPDEILERQDKIGFATPEKDFLESIKAKVSSLNSEVKKIDIFNAEELSHYVQSVSPNDLVGIRYLWRIYNYILWHRQFMSREYA